MSLSKLFFLYTRKFLLGLATNTLLSRSTQHSTEVQSMEFSPGKRKLAYRAILKCSYDSTVSQFTFTRKRTETWPVIQTKAVASGSRFGRRQDLTPLRTLHSPGPSFRERALKAPSLLILRVSLNTAWQAVKYSGQSIRLASKGSGFKSLLGHEGCFISSDQSCFLSLTG